MNLLTAVAAAFLAINVAALVVLARRWRGASTTEKRLLMLADASIFSASVYGTCMYLFGYWPK